MKKIVSIFSVAVALVLTSCGGGSSKYFGDVPSIVNDYITESMEMQEEAEKIDSESEFVKYYARYAEHEEQFEKDLLEAATKLIGTEIVCEVSEGLPFEVIGNAKITEIDKDGNTFMITPTIKIKEDIKLERTAYYQNAECDFHVKFLDSEGAIVGHSFIYYYEKDAKVEVLAAGTTLEENFLTVTFMHNSEQKYIDENNQLARLDKIVFISEDEYLTLQ